MMIKRTETAIETDNGCTDQQITKASLQRDAAYCFLALFALNSICALAMIFLVGFGRLVLSERLILTVLASTVTQGAGVLVIVVKYLFR